MMPDISETPDPVEQPANPPVEQSSSPIAPEKSTRPDVEIDDSIPAQDNNVPASLQSSPFSNDIVPTLQKDPQGFDKAVAASGDLFWALKTFKGVTPDVAAKASRIAIDGRLPFNTALRDPNTFDEWDQAKLIADSLGKKTEDGTPIYPSTAAWMKNPENILQGKNDVEALKEIEQKIRETRQNGEGFLSQTGRSLAAGTFWAIKGIYQLPNLAANIAAYPRNKIGDLASWLGKVEGDPDLQAGGDMLKVSVPMNNALSDEAQRSQDFIRPAKTPEFVASVKNKDFGGAANSIVQGIVGMVPLLAATAVDPVAGLAGFGETTAAETLTKAQDVGKTESAATEDAMMQGMIGMWGIGHALGPLVGQVSRSAAIEFGNESRMSLMKEVTKQLAKSSVKSGAALSAMTGGQAASDYITGNSHAMENITERVLNSYALGAVMGAGHESLSIYSQHKAYAQNAELMGELKSSLDKVKNLSQNPDGFADKINQDLETHGLPTSMAVDAEALTKVFYQDATTPEKQALAKDNLQKFAQDVGLDPAKLESSLKDKTPVDIDTGKLLVKYKDHPVYDAILKEHKEGADTEMSALLPMLKSMKAEIDANKEDSTLPPSLKQAYAKMTMDKEAGGLGWTSDEANKNIALVHAFAKTRARYTGETAEEVMQRYPLHLMAGEEASQFFDSVKKQDVLNQGIIKNESVESGRTSEDLELKPEFKSKYKAPAMLQDGKIIEANPGETNHASIAERLGFPKDLIPGFIDKEGNFVYQYSEDVPKVLKQDKRGAFVSLKDGRRVIGLMEKADMSTFAHEFSHYAIDVIKSEIEAGNANPELIKDFNLMADAAGVKDGKWKEDHHEFIAKEFEKYLKEGKAPSVKLASAFARFKDWMLSIYQSVKSMGVKVSPELSGAFDRMLASQKEIKEAQEYYGLKHNFLDLLTKDKDAKSELEQKRKAMLQSQEDEKVGAVMQDYLKAGKNRDAIEKDAAKEIDDTPFQKMLDSVKKEGVDFESLRKTLGDKDANELAAKYPETIRRDGTKTLEELAIENGFDSPEALLTDMKQLPDRQERINQKTEEMIKAKEGDIRKAIKSDVTSSDAEIHTEKTLDYLLAETKALAKQLKFIEAGRAFRLTVQAYRDAAREHIATLPVREARRYDLFAAAERKYSRQFAKLIQQGKTAEAFEARTKQMLNHALVLEAIKTRGEIERIENRYSPKNLISTWKNIEDAFRSPVVELLSRFGFTNKDATGFDFSKIGDIDPILAAMVPDLVTSGKTIDYSHLTVDELRQVDDFAKSLISAGRNTLRTLEEGKEIAIQDARGKAMATLAELKQKTFAQNGTVGKGVQNVMRGLGSSMEQMDFITKIADDFSLRKTGQAGVWGQFYRAMTDAQVRESLRMKELGKKSQEHFETLSDAVKRITAEHGEKFDIKELPRSEEMAKAGRAKWTAEEAIALMLNTGNDGNMLALKNGFGYEKQHLDAAAKLFDAKELQAIQKLRDVINELYPDLDKAHFDKYNVHVQKVEAKSQKWIDRNGKEVELEGGYYPLKFDKDLDLQAARNSEADLMEQKQGVLRTAKVSDGMTKSRTPGHSLPILLSMDVLNRHLAETVHYITHAEVVGDWSKFTGDQSLKNAFTDKFGDEYYHSMRQWIKDQAQRSVPPPSSWANRTLERFFNWSRGLNTVAAFGLNVKSGVLIHHSLLNAAHVLSWKHLASGVIQSDMKTLAGTWGDWTGDKMKAITEMSPYMKDHVHSWDRDVRAMSEEIKTDKMGMLDSTIRKASKAMGSEFTLEQTRELSMGLLTSAHQRMAAIIWRGAFNKYMAEFTKPEMTPKEVKDNAIKYSDSMVSELTPSSLKSELNAMQRDQGLMKFVTMFMSWNFKFGGRMMYEHKAMQEGAISKMKYANHVLHEIVLPGVVRATLLAAFSAALPNAKQLVEGPLETMLSTIPLLKDIPRVFPLNKQGKFSVDTGAMLPQTEMLKRTASAANSVVGLAQGKKEIAPVIWDLSRAADFYSGLGVTKPAHDLYKFYEDSHKEQ